MTWRCAEPGSAKEQENEGVITGEKRQLRAAPAIDDGGARELGSDGLVATLHRGLWCLAQWRM
jgi:hypothetical protein